MAEPLLGIKDLQYRQPVTLPSRTVILKPDEQLLEKMHP